MNPAVWGIAESYWDTSGVRVTPPHETLDAILAAMGAEDPAAGPPPGPPMWFVRRGDAPPLASPAALGLEDGTALTAEAALPPDLPVGYHTLSPLDGGPDTLLVVTPGRCHLPADLRAWGWAVQLYALRSRESWGMGDLADLRRLACWSSELGAGVVGLNPLHAGAPTAPHEPSPYYPTTRRWRSPLYLRVEEVPAAARAGAPLDALARAGRALTGTGRIDRDEVLRLKMEALSLIWERTDVGADPGFASWRASQLPSLRTFATFCVLAEAHGPDYRTWPAELRHPTSPAVARATAEEIDRVRFHEWLQWLVERQLAAAATVALVQDLAVGFAPGGADAWEWQDLLANGVRVGAPADDFNTRGQDWGLPPFVPWRLRAEAYAPFVETVRAMLAGAGGVRVDHVMGLFRLFWIPPGASPADGTYVRYPSSDLLDILAVESERAGAFVVGEDLGTVEDEVRAELRERGVLSYRLFWFEAGPPDRWPEQALCAVSTHDLPTVAGVWTGTDLDAQRAIGVKPNEAGAADMRRRLAAVAPREDATVDEVVIATYGALAEAPCSVVLASLDDALGVAERPNMPGTTDEWPNWTIPLPATLEEVEEHGTVRAVAGVLRDRRG